MKLLTQKELGLLEVEVNKDSVSIKDLYDLINYMEEQETDILVQMDLHFKIYRWSIIGRLSSSHRMLYNSYEWLLEN